jgi:hypothetical protein
MKTSLLMLITVAILASEGCKESMKMPQSKFLLKFRLDQSVKNIAYEGISYSSPGGSIGGSTGGINQYGADVHHSSVTGFAIKQEEGKGFNESKFLEVLKDKIAKEIEESGAEVSGRGSRGEKEFYIEYKEGNTEGRIVILGSQSGRYYSLSAQVDERTRG